jgi:hypothetical protein
MAHIGITKTALPDGRFTLSGRTFDYKEQIKAAGGKWDPALKTWTLEAAAEQQLMFLVPPLSVAPKPKPLPREEWTADQWANYCLRRRGNVGPCCRHATAKESRPYGPICYNCPRHGYTHNNYTGD